jgi:hypothetical protein
MSTPRAVTRLLIVGNPDSNHVGAHFLSAARALGIDARLCDTREAYEGPAWRRKAFWWLGGRRPVRLERFGLDVVDTVRTWKADCILATGIAPLGRAALTEIERFGARRFNFLTDDPWNPAHRASWFLDALPCYDHVWSPRTANLDDLRALRGPQVTYLPFAYAPEQHFVQPPSSLEESKRYDCAVLFAGGADADRVSTVEPLIEAGFDLGLYGGYWDRFTATNRYARGFLGPEELRKAVSAARICLCLVRRANRDGHSMRSFEVAAMGGCMLAEDTAEHRAIFGEQDEAVHYFGSPRECVSAARALIADPARRARLASAVRARIASGRHTYADRLQTIMGSAA